MASASALPNDILVADDKTALSDYDTESGVSSTQSLSSSILETTFSNGRRYHRKSQGQYFMPSDEIELGRLDLAHHLYLHLLDGELYTAPLKGHQLHNVLDLGTGTGIWALDFGETHPEARVLGVDLCSDSTWMGVPQLIPHVHFETDDIERPWLWKQNFDFIHCRTMATAIRNWPQLASQMFTHTTPGGYVVIVDHSLRTIWCDDDSTQVELAKHSAMQVYLAKLAEGLSASGINVDIDADFLVKVLEDAGFVDVKVTVTKMPFGAWPKDKKYKKAGRIVAEIATSGFEAYGLAALLALGTPAEEAKQICDDARDIVRSGKEHWYNKL